MSRKKDVKVIRGALLSFLFGLFVLLLFSLERLLKERFNQDFNSKKRWGAIPCRLSLRSMIKKSSPFNLR